MKIGPEIIGFYGLVCEQKEDKRLNILSHFFLKPTYIGKGFGKILFKETIRAAKDELKWEGFTWESDPHAAWFYKKMGAKQIGDNPCPLNHAFRAPVFIYTIL